MLSSQDPANARREAIRSRTFKARALDAALRLVELRGAEAVKLTEISAALETGAASLYYHFKNKDALLAEVSAMGFQALERAVQAAYDAGGDRASIRACGAYLHFIRDRTRLYQLMYDEPILSAHVMARDAERHAFERFAGLIRIGEGSDADRQSAALALWALGRGIAALAITADAAEPGTGRPLARQAVEGLEALMGRRLRDGVERP